MSFELSNSNNLYCTARSGYAGRGVLNNKVTVGDYEIDLEDFCLLAEYVFTNTDLEDNDVRIETVERIKEYKQVEGYNAGNKRYGNDE